MKQNKNKIIEPKEIIANLTFTKLRRGKTEGFGNLKNKEKVVIKISFPEISDKEINMLYKFIGICDSFWIQSQINILKLRTVYKYRSYAEMYRSNHFSKNDLLAIASLKRKKVIAHMTNGYNAGFEVYMGLRLNLSNLQIYSKRSVIFEKKMKNEINKEIPFFNFD